MEIFVRDHGFRGRNVILDGNPLASSHFHLLIDKEDSK